MYTVDDFNTKNDMQKEVVQFVLNSVVDFDIYYELALTRMYIERIPLRYADRRLYDAIGSVISDWALDHNITDEDYDEIDIEEIFG